MGLTISLTQMKRELGKYKKVQRKLFRMNHEEKY